MKMLMEKGVEVLARLVRWVRGERVILDADLARLYEVETRALNRAVRRNVKRFPPDFMFMLVNEEVTNLKCQIGISSSGWGGRRKPIMAFTEQGVAMLSSVLRSDRAVKRNSKCEMWPYFAPNPLRGGASKGARSGRIGGPTTLLTSRTREELRRV